MATAPEKPSSFEIWKLAVRPKLMTLSASPIIVGSAVAWHIGKFHWPVAIMALLTSMLLQITSNFANDLFDYKKGADTSERQGPPRMTQLGWVTPRQMGVATAIVIALSILCGSYLVWVGGWPILLLGLIAIVCAVAYTAGPYPLGYIGLGEVFVFIFFGFVAVTGTAWLHTGDITAMALWASIPNACLASAVLGINNLRDIETDKRAGKRTVATRIGADNARLLFRLFLLASFATPFAFWIVGWTNWTALCVLLLAPVFVKLWRMIEASGPGLNPMLGLIGRTTFLFSVLFALTLVLSA